MNPTDLIKRLRELEKSATPEWVYEPERYSAKCVIGIKPRDDRWLGHFQPEMNGEANAMLAVEMRNSLPALLDLLEKQSRALEVADEVLNNICDCETEVAGGYQGVVYKCYSCKTITTIRGIMADNK